MGTYDVFWGLRSFSFAIDNNIVFPKGRLLVPNPVPV